MTSWPPNLYLDAWLRTPEGQQYLKDNGSLESWKQRHLLDEEAPASEGGGPDLVVVSTGEYLRMSKDPLMRSLFGINASADVPAVDFSNAISRNVDAWKDLKAHPEKLDALTTVVKSDGEWDF